eukprot:3524996-Amphidinium_carterae.1
MDDVLRLVREWLPAVLVLSRSTSQVHCPSLTCPAVSCGGCSCPEAAGASSNVWLAFCALAFFAGCVLGGTACKAYPSQGASASAAD